MMSTSRAIAARTGALRAAGLPVDRRPTTPGEMLEHEFHRPSDLTVADLVRRSGVDASCLREIIRGAQAVTPELAASLSHALGTSARLWLNLQHSLDQYDALTIRTDAP